MRDPREVVAAKRDGERLSEDRMEGFVLAYARGEIADEVAAAFLMACFIRGLDEEETASLTRAMVGSGSTIALGGISRPVVDKHSTGGVADTVTLVFAPLVASLGLAVAKLSGRGLGHTGGTLDKLEAIPGLRVDLSPEELERQVEEVGCAVAAQSRDLVPADGKLYALRDATATVPSVPLIAASVMSKKLAVRSDLVLLDVKAGSGAFMKDPGDAERLAEACVGIAGAWGRRVAAAVTDMNQPLGTAIGNALDVAEAVAILRGERGGRLLDLVIELAAAAQVALGGAEEGEARRHARDAIASGRAAETFRAMVAAQGGDPRVIDDPAAVLPSAPVVRPILLERSGVLGGVDAEGLGRAAAALGAGRRRKGDPVDPAVGIVFAPKIGDEIHAGGTAGEIHARSEDAADEAHRRVVSALEVVDGPVDPPPLVYGWRSEGSDPSRTS